MKKWMLALAALIWLSPVKGTDVGKLLPVELVSVRREEESILVETDTGNFGRGADLEAAMEDLKRTAEGEVFLETANYLLLSPDSGGAWGELSGYFRPGTLVFLMKERTDPEQAARYLRGQKGGLPLNRMGEVAIPKIKLEEGRVLLEE